MLPTIAWIVLALALVLLLAWRLMRKGSLAERFGTPQPGSLDATCQDIISQCHTLITQNASLSVPGYNQIVDNLVTDSQKLALLNVPCKGSISDMLVKIIGLVSLNGQTPANMLSTMLSSTVELAISATLAASDATVQLMGVQVAIVESVGWICSLYLNGTLQSKDLIIILDSGFLATRFAASPIIGESDALKAGLRIILGIPGDYNRLTPDVFAAKYLNAVYLLLINPPKICSDAGAMIMPDDTCKCWLPYEMYLGTYTNGKCVPVITDLCLFDVRGAGPIEVELDPPFDPNVSQYTVISHMSAPYPLAFTAAAKFGNAESDMSICKGCSDPASCPSCVHVNIVGPGATYDEMAGTQGDFSDGWTALGNFAGLDPLDAFTITIAANQGSGSSYGTALYTINIPIQTSMITGLMVQDRTAPDITVSSLNPPFDPAITTYTFPIPNTPWIPQRWDLLATFGNVGLPDAECASCSGAACNQCVHTVLTTRGSTTDRISGNGTDTSLKGYTNVGILANTDQAGSATFKATQTGHTVIYTINLVPT